MTTAEDVKLAAAAGADFAGMIVAESPRRVPRERWAALASAMPASLQKIAVVVDPSDEEAAELLALGFMLQFSGDESAERCEALTNGAPYWKAYHIRPSATVPAVRPKAYAHATWLVDTLVAGAHGGTGVTFPWTMIEPMARMMPVVVAGGLRPDNVGDCVRTIRPFAVDVRSGIETAGGKDADKMRAFVRAVRDADASA